MQQHKMFSKLNAPNTTTNIRLAVSYSVSIAS